MNGHYANGTSRADIDLNFNGVVTDTVLVRVWAPLSPIVSLSLSDSQMERVANWSSGSNCQVQEYQRSRITATTTFSLGGGTQVFDADVTSLVQVGLLLVSVLF